jgi:hypothetical protein
MERIKPWNENPRFWEYRGEPVLLIGGSVEDNLFQIPNLEEHLDQLVDAGGNYVRCTMSSRDEGNVWPFAAEDGLFDLDRWNDEYWRRFDAFLEATGKRRIFVQVELWAYHDLYSSYGNWEIHPFNPTRNGNYDEESTTLENRAFYAPGPERNPFFFTVPECNNDETVLRYQRLFVAEVVKHASSHGHVLYCVTNEIHEGDPPEWGWYWAGYVRELDPSAQITEMYQPPDFDNPLHAASFDHPEIFSFFEASQNSARSGEKNWRQFLLIRDRTAAGERPINNVKIYGADTGPDWSGSVEDAIDRFWRALLAGCASARFHRPPAGLGLSTTAQAHIRSARWVSEVYDFFASEPDPSRLLVDGPEEAYAASIPGSAVLLYLPRGGTVRLATTDLPRDLIVRWLEPDEPEWRSEQRLTVAEALSGTEASCTVEAPHSGRWVGIVRGRA